MSEDEKAAAAGEALETALLKATRAVESEFARIVRGGEADIDRLALKIAETLAKLAFDTARGAPDAPAAVEAGAASFNQIAAAIARAAMKGARFT